LNKRNLRLNLIFFMGYRLEAIPTHQDISVLDLTVLVASTRMNLCSLDNFALFIRPILSRY
ncbi:hypothetical protein, partial [Desulfobacter sp.]|uniref:hypothetical protein n=1 Tax=Desulfobacter sp. TaxID=2294 RepID=UPI000E7EDB68